MKTDKTVAIQSRDYWFKIVEFLQQNWALIEPSADGVGCIVFFCGDTSGVFDRLEFISVEEAEAALIHNGFARFAADKNAQGFIAAPMPPFYESKHPNGNIYSSGRFWDNASLARRKLKRTKRKRATVIVEVDGAILLTETRKGLVLLPGGGFNRGELAIAAAARELHERIIYIYQQRACRPAFLKPAMVATVDLDQLANTVVPVARLVDPCRT